MNTLKLSKLVAIVAVASLALSACGGGGGGPARVSPGQYVRNVCTAIGDWIQSVKQRSVDLTNQAFTLARTPQQGKNLVAGFFDYVVADNENERADVENAGVPDVENGDKIVVAVRRAVEESRALLDDARDRVKTLPTDSAAAFRSATRELGTSVKSSLAKLGDALNQLKRSSQLQQAATRVLACKALAY